jgi:hypothetical protein
MTDEARQRVEREMCQDEDLARLLLEASTVLDEPYHHEAIAAHLVAASNYITRLTSLLAQARETNGRLNCGSRREPAGREVGHSQQRCRTRLHLRSGPFGSRCGNRRFTPTRRTGRSRERRPRGPVGSCPVTQGRCLTRSPPCSCSDLAACLGAGVR